MDIHEMTQDECIQRELETGLIYEPFLALPVIKRVCKHHTTATSTSSATPPPPPPSILWKVRQDLLEGLVDESKQALVHEEENKEDEENRCTLHAIRDLLSYPAQHNNTGTIADADSSSDKETKAQAKISRNFIGNGSRYGVDLTLYLDQHPMHVHASFLVVMKKRSCCDVKDTNCDVEVGIASNRLISSMRGIDLIQYGRVASSTNKTVLLVRDTKCASHCNKAHQEDLSPKSFPSNVNDKDDSCDESSNPSNRFLYISVNRVNMMHMMHMMHMKQQTHVYSNSNKSKISNNSIIDDSIDDDLDYV